MAKSMVVRRFIGDSFSLDPNYPQRVQRDAFFPKH